jgi:hypothetical protein
MAAITARKNNPMMTVPGRAMARGTILGGFPNAYHATNKRSGTPKAEIHRVLLTDGVSIKSPLFGGFVVGMVAGLRLIQLSSSPHPER